MSRNPINEDMGLLGRAMDLLTIDGSRLQIPSSGVRGKPRGRGVDLRFMSIAPGPGPGPGQERDLSEAACAPFKHDEVIVDVRPRAPVEAQVVLETPMLAVPLGYFAFCLALALCNLLQPLSARTACVALSPLPMLCILAHAAGVRPVWVGWGVTVCGWLVPSVCALWSVVFGVCYLIGLSVLVVAGCRRPLPGACLLTVIACSGLALNPQWTGLEPKVYITVETFLTALTCASAYLGGGRVACRLKNYK